MFGNNKNIRTVETVTPPLKCGFTLAETLITLVIIGIVAALTVPTLIVKYQKEQTVTRLKKAYSALTQTTQRAIADNGPITTWEIGEQNNANDAKLFFNKYLAPYLNLSVPAKTYDEGHWNSEQNLLNNTESNYNYKYSRAYLLDGSSVTFYIHTNNAATKRINFNIDVNGDKKPNKLGKDIFRLMYLVNSGRFKIDGIEKTRAYLVTNVNYNCNKNNEGYYCLALIVKDGWQIKDDYPW